MKKYAVVLLLSLSLILTAFDSQAGLLGNRFHFGLSGGAGIGRLSEATAANGAEDYGTISWMVHAGVRFTQRAHLRLSLGLDNYRDFASSSDTRDITSDDGWLFAGDIDALFHFFKNPLPLFDPYLIGGVGYPRALHAGLGLDVSTGGTFGIFAEALYGTAFIDNRGLGRLGIKIKF